MTKPLLLLPPLMAEPKFAEDDAVEGEVCCLFSRLEAALLAPLLQLALIVAYFLVSWWTAHRITQRLSVADAPQIVADEVVGMWLALWLIGIVSDAAAASIDATPALLALVWAAAFALFRWLDIAKPSLIGWLDTNIKGGLGVMLDDVVAGLVTGGVIGIVLWLTTLG